MRGGKHGVTGCPECDKLLPHLLSCKDFKIILLQFFFYCFFENKWTWVAAVSLPPFFSFSLYFFFLLRSVQLLYIYIYVYECLNILISATRIVSIIPTM